MVIWSGELCKIFSIIWLFLHILFFLVATRLNRLSKYNNRWIRAGRDGRGERIEIGPTRAATDTPDSMGGRSDRRVCPSFFIFLLFSSFFFFPDASVSTEHENKRGRVGCELGFPSFIWGKLSTC